MNRKKVLCLVLALILCAYALGVSPDWWGNTAGATQAKINGMKNQISQITGQIKEIQAQLDEVKNDKSKAIQQKQYLDSQIALSDERIAQLDAILAAYDEAIAEKQQEIDGLRAQEEAQYTLFCQRVRSMEE